MKTKDYCMTRFFRHGQSILQVFETSIALSMVKSVKSPFFQTLLIPISWTLAIYSQQSFRIITGRKSPTGQTLMGFDSFLQISLVVETPSLKKKHVQ